MSNDGKNPQEKSLEKEVEKKPQELTQEEKLKARIEELRRRDPFVYR